MSEQARAHLKKAIDLLGPNVWLELDDVSFPRFLTVRCAATQTRSRTQKPSRINSGLYACSRPIRASLSSAAPTGNETKMPSRRKWSASTLISISRTAGSGLAQVISSDAYLGLGRAG